MRRALAAIAVAVAFPVAAQDDLADLAAITAKVGREPLASNCAATRKRSSTRRARSHSSCSSSGSAPSGVVPTAPR
jgi:hypothetical protein